MNRKHLLLVAAPTLAVGALLAVAALVPGCSSTWDRRDPTGEVFPSVLGTTLDGGTVALPEEFRGRPVLLLVGYQRNSQFDLDRWLLGLTESGVDVDVREVPTIPGLVPGAFSGWIDAGMRRGIPREDWGSVITVYGDADAVAAFTGNRDGLPGRILLLDREGRVVFFHDRGYSAGSLRRLREALAPLRPADPERPR